MYQSKQYTYKANLFILTPYFYDVISTMHDIDIENETFEVEYEVTLDDDEDIFSNMLYEAIQVNGVSYKGKDIDLPIHELSRIELEYYDELLEHYYNKNNSK